MASFVTVRSFAHSFLVWLFFVPAVMPCDRHDSTPAVSILSIAPNDAASRAISDILKVVGLQPNFEIRSAKVPNAAAVILDSKRFILYNPEFMNAINSASGTNWAGISILAHEIGHHLNGHTLGKGRSRPDLELEADEFSGFVLHKMGATLQEAQTAMAIAASQKASHTHPAKKDRLIAIAGGWNNARALDSPKDPVADRAAKPSVSVKKPSAVRNAVVKPVIVNRTAAKTQPIAEQYIAFDVDFHADRSNDYFITTRGNLVTVDGDDLYLIGRLSESNRRGYKLMLADKHYNYLYIGDGGKIVNGSGNVVGSISKR